jgi:hypothetical protein
LLIKVSASEFAVNSVPQSGIVAAVTSTIDVQWDYAVPGKDSLPMVVCSQGDKVRFLWPKEKMVNGTDGINL